MGFRIVSSYISKYWRVNMCVCIYLYGLVIDKVYIEFLEVLSLV